MIEPWIVGGVLVVVGLLFAMLAAWWDLRRRDRLLEEAGLVYTPVGDAPAAEPGLRWSYPHITAPLPWPPAPEPPPPPTAPFRTGRDPRLSEFRSRIADLEHELERVEAELADLERGAS